MVVPAVIQSARIAVAALVLALPTQAAAEPPTKPAAPAVNTAAPAVKAPAPPQATVTPAPAAPRTFANTLEDLAALDRARVARALAELGAMANARSVPPVKARIEEGLPPDLLGNAIEVLRASRSAAAGPVLQDLLRHRRAAVRAAAATALGALAVRSAGKPLIAALSDPDGQVRSASLVALGLVREPRAVEPVSAAVQRGEGAAVVVLAQLVRPADVARLVAYARTRPFSTMQPAFDTVMARPDFPSRGKVDLIAKVGELRTPAAEQYLRDLLTRLPAGNKAPMMRAIDDAIRVAREEAAPPPGAPSTTGQPATPSQPAPAHRRSAPKGMSR